MEKNFFDQPVKNKLITGQGDDYTTSCLLDYDYFRDYYKLIAMNLSKQQALDGDPKTIQRIKLYWKSRSRRKQNNVFHY